MDGAEKKEETVLAVTARETAPSPVTVLEQMFSDYHDLVYRTAYRVTGNSSDAEDILQSVFLRLVRQDALPELGGSASSYFRRAAINAAIDQLRSLHSSRRVPLDEVEMHLEDGPASNPDHRMMAKEIRGFLRKSVADLKPRDAEIFVLSAFEGYGNKEIAALVDLPHTTVAVLLHRIRTRLLNDMRLFLGGEL